MLSDAHPSAWYAGVSVVSLCRLRPYEEKKCFTWHRGKGGCCVGLKRKVSNSGAKGFDSHELGSRRAVREGCCAVTSTCASASMMRKN
eukprot:5624587-Pleurochrysis_carterae.AAC.2